MIHNIIYKINLIFTLKLERLFFVKWFNPFATLYFYIRCLSFRDAIKIPVLIYGCPRFYSLYGKISFPEKCYFGMVKLNATIAGAPSYTGGNTELNIWGNIIFRGKCIIGTSNKINVGRGGILDMGDGTKIMHYCNITAYSTIKIGEQSWIVHRCQVLDTNFHYVADFNNHIVKQQYEPITIGTYCWICNSTTVTSGVIIPNKTIVASYSLVNKDFSSVPEESIIGGIPAKLIATGYRKIENRKFESEIINHFNDNPKDTIFRLPANIEHNCCDV